MNPEIFFSTQTHLMTIFLNKNRTCHLFTFKYILQTENLKFEKKFQRFKETVSNINTTSF